MWGILPFLCISVWWPWESATTYLLQSLVVQRLTFAHSCWYISVAWPADWAQCLLWKIIDSLELLKNKCRRVCEFLNKPNHSLQFNLPVLLAPALWLVFMALLSFGSMWILQCRQENRTQADCGTQGVLPLQIGSTWKRLGPVHLERNVVRTVKILTNEPLVCFLSVRKPYVTDVTS